MLTSTLLQYPFGVDRFLAYFLLATKDRVMMILL